MTTSALASQIIYSGTAGSASWEGRHIDDVQRFEKFVRHVVRSRIADEASSFAPDLRALATTGMKTDFLERLLKAVPEPEDWEIGEAFAECALLKRLWT